MNMPPVPTLDTTTRLPHVLDAYTIIAGLAASDIPPGSNGERILVRRAAAALRGRRASR